MSAVSTASLWTGGAVLFAAAVTASTVMYIVDRCIVRAAAAYYAGLSFGFLAHAAWMFRVGEHAAAVVYLVGAVIGAALAWLFWRKRPPRKRRPSKIAARVRDLGHRLVVAPAGAAA